MVVFSVSNLITFTFYVTIHLLFPSSLVLFPHLASIYVSSPCPLSLLTPSSFSSFILPPLYLSLLVPLTSQERALKSKIRSELIRTHSCTHTLHFPSPHAHIPIHTSPYTHPCTHIHFIPTRPQYTHAVCEGHPITY